MSKYLFTLVLAITVHPAKAQPCIAPLRVFDSHTVMIDGPWLQFTNDEIQASMNVLRDLPLMRLQRVTLRYISTPKPQSIDSLPEQLPVTVRDKLHKMFVKIWNFYRELKHKVPEDVFVDMRLTCDRHGVRITRECLGDAHTGLHTHALLSGETRDAIDFVWALHGSGARVQLGNRIHQVKTNQILLFGADVLHGSPASDRERLVIVGGAHTRTN